MTPHPCMTPNSFTTPSFATPKPDFALPFDRRDRSRPRSHHRSRGEHDSERHGASPPPSAPPPASGEDKEKDKEAPKKLNIVGDAIKQLQMQLQKQAANSVQTLSPQEMALRRAARL
jgi:hypothetical protein